MPQSVSKMLGAILDLTDDALLVIDPRERVVQYASPRAIDLIGPMLNDANVSISQVFSNDATALDDFLNRAVTVTDPIISSVTIGPDNRVLSAKARRLPSDDGTPAVLLLLDGEPELSHRFRLISEKVSELRTEVGRRVLAEKRLSAHMQALQRAVSVIHRLSEIDVSSADYLIVAAATVAQELQTRGSLLITERFGKLHVISLTGIYEGTFDADCQIDLSIGEFAQTWRDDPGHSNTLLYESLQRASSEDLVFDDALMLPLSVSGEMRGALICLRQTETLSEPATHFKADIIVDVLGSMIARAETEARLIHAQKLQAIGQLTGGIAHDFNNILAVVLGNAELLLDEMRGIDTELAQEIRDAAIRGATLTSRLLAFARKQPLKPESTEINSLLREFDPLIRRSIGEHIDFQLITGGGLWRGLLDRSQFENAVLNLVVNARDAMPEGGRLTLETANSRLDEDYAARHSEVRPGQYVMVGVSDTGTGMEPAIMKEAFTPFFTTKPVGKGSGLGLSMVFGFVKQSDGHVKIYSEPGLGTTIRMYFPRDLSDIGKLTSDGDSHSIGAPIGKGRILVAEDDPGVLKFIERNLTLLGYVVDAVASGDRAADLLAHKTYDLLLTDVVLPGATNGAKLANIAHQLAPDMPVLFMSGYTDNAIVHHGRLDPGVEFLSKPFTRDQLAKRLKALMGN